MAPTIVRENPSQVWIKLLWAQTWLPWQHFPKRPYPTATPPRGCGSPRSRPRQAASAGVLSQRRASVRSPLRLCGFARITLLGVVHCVGKRAGRANDALVIVNDRHVAHRDAGQPGVGDVDNCTRPLLPENRQRGLHYRHGAEEIGLHDRTQPAASLNR